MKLDIVDLTADRNWRHAVRRPLYAVLDTVCGFLSVCFLIVKELFGVVLEMTPILAVLALGGSVVAALAGHAEADVLALAGIGAAILALPNGRGGWSR